MIITIPTIIIIGLTLCFQGEWWHTLGIISREPWNFSSYFHEVEKKPILSPLCQGRGHEKLSSSKEGHDREGLKITALMAAELIVQCGSERVKRPAQCLLHTLGLRGSVAKVLAEWEWETVSIMGDSVLNVFVFHRLLATTAGQKWPIGLDRRIQSRLLCSWFAAIDEKSFLHRFSVWRHKRFKSLRTSSSESICKDAAVL